MKFDFRSCSETITFSGIYDRLLYADFFSNAICYFCENQRTHPRPSSGIISFPQINAEASVGKAFSPQIKPKKSSNNSCETQRTHPRKSAGIISFPQINAEASVGKAFSPQIKPKKSSNNSCENQRTHPRPSSGIISFPQINAEASVGKAFSPQIKPKKSSNNSCETQRTHPRKSAGIISFPQINAEASVGKAFSPQIKPKKSSNNSCENQRTHPRKSAGTTFSPQINADASSGTISFPQINAEASVGKAFSPQIKPKKSSNNSCENQRTHPRKSAGIISFPQINAEASVGTISFPQINAEALAETISFPQIDADASAGTISFPQSNAEASVGKALAALLSLLILCQTNLRAQLTETDTLKFGYRASLNGSWLKGNVDRLLLIATADVSHVSEMFGVRSSNNYQFGTFGKFRTENDFVSKNFIYLIPKKRIYPYLMGWLETNLRRQINFRYQVGPGATFTALRKSNHQFKLSATLLFETTYFNSDRFIIDAYNGEKKIETVRTTLRIFGKHQMLKNRFRFRYELWVQPSVLDVNNFRAHADVFIETPINKKFSFRTGLNYNYENIVLTNVKQQDVFWTFGLSFANN